MMISVTIVNTESTTFGDMAELILEKTIEPAIGMILIDEDSNTWEVKGILHDASRTTENGSSKHYTLQCVPVNSDMPIHTGSFKLMH